MPAPEQGNNLARFGVPVEFRFLEHRRAVRDDFESAAARPG